MNGQTSIKNLLKTTLKKGMQGVGHLTSTHKIPILMYHSIDDSQSCLSVSPTNFQNQMAYLKEKGYRTIHLTDFYYYLIKKIKLSNKIFAITFDDGYQNNYIEAFPILEKFSFTATVFLATDYVGDKARWILSIPKRTEISKLKGISKFKMLSWQQIKEMSSYGIDFGAHTCSHPFLDNLTITKASREIYESKRIIEKNINKEVTSFSYPYGVSTPKIRQLTNDAGYLLAVEDKVGLNDSKSDPCALKRIPVGDVDTDEFAFYFSKGFSLYAGLQKQYRALMHTMP